MLIFCLGFLFNSRCNKVALIRKDHPWQQKGKLNGVGGKVLPNEEIRDAMSREFTEEAGRIIHPDSWHHYLTVTGNYHKIYCYRSILMGVELPFRTDTPEPVNWHELASLADQQLVSGVSWMIPMALDGYVRVAEVSTK